MSKVVILVAYHKKATLLKTGCLYPLQVGRRVAESESKDGQTSAEERAWLAANLMGDDSGENISAKNRYYSELTGLYWAWRHYEALGRPQYLGMMHYRRLFCFSESRLGQILGKRGQQLIPESNLIFTDPLESFTREELETLFEDRLIEEILQDVDLLGPLIHTENTQDDKFRQRSDLMVYSDLSKTLEIVRQDYPQYLSLVEQAMHTQDNYLFNMFIMKWPLLEACCEFIFGVLFKLEQRLWPELQTRTPNQRRVFGYLSEVLFTAFFIKMQQDGRKIRNLKLIYATDYAQDDSYRSKYVYERLPGVVREAADRVRTRAREGGRIFIYGAGDLGEQLLFAIKEQGLDVAGLFDRQVGQRFGYEVKAFSRDLVAEHDLIVIASQAYASEIEKTIEAELDGQPLTLIKL